MKKYELSFSNLVSVSNIFTKNKVLLFSMFCCFVVILTSCEKKSTPSLKDDIPIDLRHTISNVNNPFDPCKGDVKVAICTCNGEEKSQIRDILSEYNSIPNISLNFVEIECDEDWISADIFFDCSIKIPNRCLDGFARPNGPNWPNQVFIGLNDDMITDREDCCGETLTDEEALCYKKGVMMHELLHAIGFGHTNDTTATHIPGTLIDDPNSILNEGNCESLRNCELSDGDIAAIQTLYPLCGCPDLVEEHCDCPELFDDVDYCECQELAGVADCECDYAQIIPNFDITFNGPICMGDVVRFNITPIPSWQQLNVTEWSISGSMAKMSGNGKFLIAEALSPGSSTICATVVSNCGLEKTICINVVVQSESNCNGDEIPNPK